MLSAVAVEGVTDDGNAQPQGMSGVDAELMCASSEGGEKDATTAALIFDFCPVGNA